MTDPILSTGEVGITKVTASKFFGDKPHELQIQFILNAEPYHVQIKATEKADFFFKLEPDHDAIQNSFYLRSTYYVVGDIALLKGHNRHDPRIALVWIDRDAQRIVLRDQENNDLFTFDAKVSFHLEADQVMMVAELPQPAMVPYKFYPH